MDKRRVFAFLHDRLSAGQRAVLVTVIAVEGSSMRGPGTHMGVCEDGGFTGSLSGGCIENAVVAEALDALAAGGPRVVRFGAGSPYIDIKLPCGGGLDIHFLPLENAELTGRCLNAIDAREPFSLRLLTGPEIDGTESARFDAHWTRTAWSPDAGCATIGHWPGPKLLIIGHGAAVPALAHLARQMDLAVEVLTPDEQLLAGIQEDGVPARHLATPGQTAAIQTDRWTAVVFLFHDHDWEIALMAHAMGHPHFYLGAMGGCRAHALRSEALLQLGLSAEAIAAIRAPIGLFHSSRDPDTLALSTLGQVVETYHKTNFSDGQE